MPHCGFKTSLGVDSGGKGFSRISDVVGLLNTPIAKPPVFAELGADANPFFAMWLIHTCGVTTNDHVSLCANAGGGAVKPHTRTRATAATPVNHCRSRFTFPP